MVCSTSRHTGLNAVTLHNGLARGERGMQIIRHRAMNVVAPGNIFEYRTMRDNNVRDFDLARYSCLHRLIRIAVYTYEKFEKKLTYTGDLDKREESWNFLERVLRERSKAA